MNFSWSLSALNMFERCGFSYACRYYSREVAQIMGLSVVPKTPPPGPAAQRGLDMHKTIENFFVHRHPLTPELEKWRPAFQELMSPGFESYPEHRISVGRDWSLSEWSNAWGRAVLDLKVIKPQVVTIYDWKSGKEYPEHYEQKELYAVFTSVEHPAVSSIKAVHVYFDSGRQTIREYHRDQMPERRQRWENRVERMEEAVQNLKDHPDLLNLQLNFPQSPNFTCRWCAFSRAQGGPCKF
jgi:hypothetical protein